MPIVPPLLKDSLLLFRPDPLFFSSFDDEAADEELELDELLEDEDELELEELDELEDDLLLFFFFFFFSRSSYITKPSSLLSARASSNLAGSCFSRSLSHLQASFLRPARVSLQTFSKFPSLQKFSVTAIVLSRFSTACHQPPGTKIHSPGC